VGTKFYRRSKAGLKSQKVATTGAFFGDSLAMGLAWTWSAVRNRRRFSALTTVTTHVHAEAQLHAM